MYVFCNENFEDYFRLPNEKSSFYRATVWEYVLLAGHESVKILTVENIDNFDS
jgi:hypothetical protein